MYSSVALCAAIIAFAACGAPAPSRSRLHGLVLDAQLAATDRFEMGRVGGDLADGAGRITVSWRPGTPSTSDVLVRSALASLAGPGTPLEAVAPLTVPGGRGWVRRHGAAQGTTPAAVALIGCDRRAFVLWFDSRPDRMATVDRVLASVRCEESAQPILPSVMTDVRPGWARLPADDGGLALVRPDGAAVIAFTESSNRLPRHDPEQVLIDKVLALTGAKAATARTIERHPGGERTRWDLPDDPRGRRQWVLTTYCDQPRHAVVVIVAAPQPLVAETTELLASMRCRAPTAAFPEYPVAGR
jgi:hypothetical protein